MYLALFRFFISFLTHCHRLPLPKEVPLDFRVLPEYIPEDVIDYLFFAVRYALVPSVISNSSSRLSDMDPPASS